MEPRSTGAEDDRGACGAASRQARAARLGVAHAAWPGDARCTGACRGGACGGGGRERATTTCSGEETSRRAWREIERREESGRFFITLFSVASPGRRK
jgi:hypothetical protein